MSRIEKLRKEVFLKSSFSDYYYYLFYKEYDRIASLPEEDRYVEAFYSAFSNLTPSISEGELIVGKRDVPMSAEEQTEWDNAYKNIALNRKNKAGGGQDSHMAIDYELVLTVGINGIVERIDRFLENCSEENFYTSKSRH